MVQRGGAYIWAVKDNQPDLVDDIRTLFRDPPPGEAFGQTVTVGQHGDRHERRTLLASAALTEAGYLRWPHAGQVCAIKREITRKAKTTVEWGYAITSLPPAQASPQRLLALWRGHWTLLCCKKYRRAGRRWGTRGLRPLARQAAYGGSSAALRPCG